jgi:hypothetical protein
MFKTLTDAFKIKEVRNKLLLTLLLLLLHYKLKKSKRNKPYTLNVNR